MDERDRRRGELHGLRDIDPAQLIAAYHRMAKSDPDQPLPDGVTFITIVEAILDYESSIAPQSNGSSTNNSEL